jgi:hypothetical protein
LVRNPKTKELVGGMKHLVEYVERIHDEYFPDYQKWEPVKA